MEATSVDVKRQSASQWLLTWAQPQKGLYLQSILLAVGNVLLKILPYFLIADVVGMFLNEEKDFAAYVVKAALIALSFLGAELCHSLSTSLSHQATFSVLASVRKACCDKLAQVPLGYVKDTPLRHLQEHYRRADRQHGNHLGAYCAGVYRQPVGADAPSSTA